jgi:hypothetical protein
VYPLTCLALAPPPLSLAQVDFPVLVSVLNIAPTASWTTARPTLTVVANARGAAKDFNVPHLPIA